MKILNKFTIAQIIVILFSSSNSFSQNGIEDTYQPDKNRSQQVVVDDLLSKSVLVEIPSLDMHKVASDLPNKTPMENTGGKKEIPFNPVPDELVIDKTQRLDVKDGLALRGKQSVFADDLSFVLLSSKGTDLYVDYGEDIAHQYDLPPFDDAYCLTINDAGVAIVGYSEDGARKGIEAFKQILYSSAVKGSQFPFVQISDY